MKKIIFTLFLVLIAGCTAPQSSTSTTASDEEVIPEIEWCTESIASLAGFTNISNTTVYFDNISMPSSEVISMCCVEAVTNQNGGLNKFCTINPDEFETNMQMYYRMIIGASYVESYTYTNESHGCMEVYNNSIMQMRQCRELD
jgi:hypothetical protein